MCSNFALSNENLLACCLKNWAMCQAICGNFVLIDGNLLACRSKNWAMLPGNIQQFHAQ